MSKNNHRNSEKDIFLKSKPINFIFNYNKIYGLDIRSLLLFRFSLGMLLFYNLIIYKFLSFKSVYSPITGIMGNDFLIHLSNKDPLSWIKYIHTDFMLCIIFLLAAVCYLLFAFSIKPFFSALFSYILFSAINLRFYPVRAGWDFYIDVLLFLSIFLSLFKKKHIIKFELRTKFSFLIIFQIGIIYLLAAISKDGITWKNGTAISYILADRQINTHFANGVLKVFPSIVVKLFTYLTLIWEFLIIFCLFIPYKNKSFRLAVSISILIFHWTINLFADVGHFKYVTTCTAILLLPDIFWNKIPLKNKIDNFANSFYNKDHINSFSAKIETQKMFNVFSNLLFYYLLSSIIFNNILFILKKNKIVEVNSPTNISNITSYIYPKKSFFFNQNWAMYSPNPMSDLGVIKIEGKLNSGEFINIINPKNQSIDIFKKDFKTYTFDNQLLTLLKAKIIQNKDYPVVQSWFNYYINQYVNNPTSSHITTAYLFLYSINGKENIENNKYMVRKTEIIKADISY